MGAHPCLYTLTTWIVRCPLLTADRILDPLQLHVQAALIASSHMEITADYWRLLKITENYWRLLKITKDYWRLLKITRKLLEFTIVLLTGRSFLGRR